MAREVIKYSFNKNHIKIFTVENCEHKNLYPNVPCYDVIERANPNKTYWDYGMRKKYEDKVTYITKQSPLGFYYKSKVVQRWEPHRFIESSYRTQNIVTFVDKNDVIHQLAFMTKWGENEAVKTEDGLRPWDICEGDKDFPDKMIQALWEDVNNFFYDMETSGVKKLYKRNHTGYYYENIRSNITIDLYNVKKEVFEYLFGSIKGIRFQTDMEKIISHGFDPKYSFRKDKEKK